MFRERGTGGWGFLFLLLEILFGADLRQAGRPPACEQPRGSLGSRCPSVFPGRRPRPARGQLGRLDQHALQMLVALLGERGALDGLGRTFLGSAEPAVTDG